MGKKNSKKTVKIKRTDGIVQGYNINADVAVPQPSQNINQVFQTSEKEHPFNTAETAWSKTHQEAQPEEPIYADEIVNRLQTIDELGLKAANKLMFLRERTVDLKSSFSQEGQQQAEELSNKSYHIHAAILRAREEIRQAKAFIEGDYIAPALPGYTSVIDADNLSNEAEALAEMIEEKTEEGLNPENKYRIAQANAHIAQARKTISEALEN